MPQRLLHKAQVLKSLTKRNLSTQAWSYHKSLKPHKEVLGRAHKGFRKSVFVGGTSIFQKGEGEKLLYLPPKTSHWKLASKNWNIRFWNRIIQNLKYSRYRENRTLRFENQNILFSQGLVRGGVYKAIVFHSSYLSF
jgi:hypothetical protein